MNVLCIDPGTFESGYVLWDGALAISGNKIDNDCLLELIVRNEFAADHLALEMMDARGVPAGYELMRTLVWIGQFKQAFGPERTTEITRGEVQVHMCGDRKFAKDANVRQVVIDRFGGDSVARGGVKCDKCKGKGWVGRGRPPCDRCNATGWKFPPGPLKCFSDHLWQALAVGITYFDLHVPSATA